MAKRKIRDDSALKNSLYPSARASAQENANRYGVDYGLEWNAVFRQFHTFMLPARANRSGHELRCEVVSPERIENTLPGHGCR